MPKRKDNLYETTYYFKGKQYLFMEKRPPLPRKRGTILKNYKKPVHYPSKNILLRNG